MKAARLPFTKGLVAVCKFSQLNAGHVSQIYNVTLRRIVANNDILELGYLVQTAICQYVVLECLRSGLGLPPDRTGGYLEVLFSERNIHIRGRHLQRCQLLGVQPDTHTEVVAERCKVAHAFNAK